MKTPKRFAPCGCAVWCEDDALHVLPCRDECPNVPVLMQAARETLGPVPVHDLRREPDPRRDGCGQERPS